MVQIWKIKFINGLYVKENENAVPINDFLFIVVILMSFNVDKIKHLESIWKESKKKSHIWEVWC